MKNEIVLQKFTETNARSGQAELKGRWGQELGRIHMTTQPVSEKDQTTLRTSLLLCCTQKSLCESGLSILALLI